MGSDASMGAQPNEMGTTAPNADDELSAFRLVRAYPPNMHEIEKRFPMARNHGVVFAWGGVVYSPTIDRLPPEIVAHETIHCRRQLWHPGGPQAWWERYLDDPAFTLAEEALAHRAEWLAVLHGVPLPSTTRQRTMRRLIAERLSGPLYGHAITMAEALAVIAGDEGYNFRGAERIPGSAP